VAVEDHADYFDKNNLESIQYFCYLNLVMTLFRVTAIDLKYGNKEAKREAKKFLNSEWFCQICSNMNLDPKYTKITIITSEKIGSRNQYE
jgi:hypothetical protein